MYTKPTFKILIIGLMALILMPSESPANWGYGLYGGMQACPWGYGAGAGVSSNDDEIHELKQDRKDLKDKIRKLERQQTQLEI